MFYNSEMLSKRGPLARVWMASHLSTKLSKSNLLATSIPSSVSSILGEALLPMALRLSGQLLLGVARIYSRKAKYLLDDCNETLGKVKRAFRPGAVDLDETEVGSRTRDAINLRAEEGGIEDLLFNDADQYWDINANAAPVASTSKAAKRGNTTATQAQISLAEDHFGSSDLQFDTGLFGDDFGGDGGLDLNLFGDDPDMQDMIPGGGEADAKGKKRARSEGSDDDESVELGRDAPGSAGRASARKSSNFGGLPDGGEDGFDLDGDVTMNSAKAGQFDLGEGEAGDVGGMGEMDFDQGDFFAGHDFGATGDEPIQRADGDKTPQPEDDQAADDTLGLTPKTAADLARVAKRTSAKKPKLGRKQVVDSVTELEWENGSVAKAAQKENLFTEPHYLPRSRLHLRLLQVGEDPQANALLTHLNANDEDYMYAAPAGLAPELQDLFQFQTRRAKIAALRRERSPTADDQSVELGRRAASEIFVGGEGEAGDVGGMGEMDFDQGDFFAGHDFGLGADESVKEFQFDLDEEAGSQAVDKRAAASKKRSSAVADLDDQVSVRSSPDRQFDSQLYELGVPSTSFGPLAIFDDVSGGQLSQSQLPSSQQQSHTSASQQGFDSLGETEEEAALAGATQTARDEKKWSKNTVKALGVLRASLGGEDEPLVFEKVAEKASRRAAAAFFFELLVLSTRDCIKVEQAEAYGSITVLAKERLWDDVNGAAVAV